MNTKTRSVLAVTLAIGGLIAATGSASATECTPKGCTGGCRIDVSDWRIDDSGNVVISSPIECTS